MKIIQEFKEFTIRGNVIDMVVGIVVGASFTKIVNSLVTDVLMPPIAMMTKQIDFSSLYINLSGGEFASLKEAQAAGAVTINYGLFINNLITFIIVAFFIFMIVKWVNDLRRNDDVAQETPSPTQQPCPFCFSKISLKATRCPFCTSEIPPSDL